MLTSLSWLTVDGSFSCLDRSTNELCCGKFVSRQTMCPTRSSTQPCHLPAISLKFICVTVVWLWLPPSCWFAGTSSLGSDGESVWPSLIRVQGILKAYQRATGIHQAALTVKRWFSSCVREAGMHRAWRARSRESNTGTSCRVGEKKSSWVGYAHGFRVVPSLARFKMGTSSRHCFPTEGPAW
jgi:hypothetical protein